MSIRHAVSSLLSVAALVAPASSQGKRGPVVKPTVFAIHPAAQMDPTRIIVKFVEGSSVRLRGAAFVAAPGFDLADVHAAVKELERVERVFLLPEADLDRDRAQILGTLPAATEPPADLNLYYRFVAKDTASGIALWRAMNALAVVELAFPDHLPGIDADPQDIPPATPDFAPRQTYQSPAPVGIDLAVARVIPGGRGEQLQIGDIETGLIVDHEDVPRAIAANVIGPNPSPTDHGLAVAGEMVADKNGYGVTGGVYKARYKFHSHQSANWASSVATMAANSSPGDIIVLEVQLTHSTGRICPMEVRQDVFDATRNATLAGKHVIAAAGNGSNDLDLPVFGGIFDRNLRDSGAVLVGATDGNRLARASFSNYGSIVDANGWGFNVVTTGYTDLFYPNSDRRQKYTATFSGTSSATPIVTSAAAAVLSAAKQQLGVTIGVGELRALLRLHGTDVPAGRIGVRPDLAKLFPAIGIVPVLSLRNEAIIGGPLDLDLEGKPNQFFALFAAPLPGEFLTPFGRFLLSGFSFFFAGAGALDGNGDGSFSTVVPNDPALLYQESHWQALRMDASLLDLSLTNSILTHLER